MPAAVATVSLLTVLALPWLGHVGVLVAWIVGGVDGPVGILDLQRLVRVERMPAPALGEQGDPAGDATDDRALPGEIAAVPFAANIGRGDRLLRQHRHRPRQRQ